MLNNTKTLGIAAVERETGLSKDTLRVWERHYRFPQPERSACGERAYSVDQVHRLRLISKLMDQGTRSGRIVGLDIAALLNMVENKARPRMHGAANRMSDRSAELMP